MTIPKITAATTNTTYCKIPVATTNTTIGKVTATTTYWHYCVLPTNNLAVNEVVTRRKYKRDCVNSR